MGAGGTTANGTARWRRAGYSLMEMTVSAAAASMLMAGIGSTIYVASRATSDAGGQASPVVSGTMTIEQLASDLEYAVTFTERSPTAVEFTIADRNGDASAETIRYEWSATAGDPVTRSFNGGTPQTVAADVHNFNLDYRIQTVTQETSSSPGGTESAEMLLASFTGWSGVTPTETYKQLSTTSWVSEYFEPTWPAGAEQLKITRVRFLMAKGSGTADYAVGIYPAASGAGPAPDATPIGTVQSISGTGLTSTYQWQEITFDDVVLSNASSGYNVVLQGLNSGARVQYYYSASAPSDSTAFVYSISSGSTWVPTGTSVSRYDAPFYVYGTYTSSSASTTSTDRYFVRNVGIALQVGADTGARMETSSEVLNAPEVAGP